MQSVIIGTAQWGLDYGITNAAGRLSDQVVTGLRDAAVARGVSRLDTAPAYGDAEVRVGSMHGPLEVQTKVSARGQSVEDIAVAVYRSLDRLKMDRVSAVLVHDWHELPSGDRAVVVKALTSLKAADRVLAIGVSAYDEADLASAQVSFPDLGVVQVPVSVLDQRLVGRSVIDELRDSGVQIQARSIFLQGAALTEPDHPPFGDHPDVVRLRVAAAAVGCSASELCVAFISDQPWVDAVVIAPTSVPELDEILGALGHGIPGIEWPALASADEYLIDPRRWAS